MLTKELECILEMRQKFILVAVVDRDSEEMAFLNEGRMQTSCADIQDICNAILLQVFIKNLENLTFFQEIYFWKMKFLHDVR